MKNTQKTLVQTLIENNNRNQLNRRVEQPTGVPPQGRSVEYAALFHPTTWHWLGFLILASVIALNSAHAAGNNGKNPAKDGPGAPMFTEGDAAYKGQTNALGNVSQNAPDKVVDKFQSKVNQAPTISWTTPSPTVVTAPANFNLEVNAQDVDGSVAKVEYFKNGTLLATVTTAPFRYQWNSVPAATYSITAKATDNLGMSATTQSLTLISNAPPTIKITGPASNSEFDAPADIPLAVEATDSDGTISEVKYFQNGRLFAGTNAAPYDMVWQQVSPGEYQVKAVATDNYGATGESAPINVIVVAREQIYYIHPDHLGTPRVITDENQQEVWRWDNADPFGDNAANEDPDGNGRKFEFNLRFPGQYYDSETRLAYNYYRDYDPSTGRYVQSDPIGLRGGVNTYGYVGGNPISKLDSYGLFDWDTDIEPVSHFMTGGGGTVDLSKHCDVYLKTPEIIKLEANARSEINEKNKDYAKYLSPGDSLSSYHYTQLSPIVG